MEDFNEKWMNYFFKIASVVSEQSKDPSTKVGAVIVTQDKQIVSTGYNGFPVNIDDSEERYNDRPTKLKYVVHAEANAITRAAKQGIKLDGCTMFVTLPPCMNCAKLIIQSGISKVYFLDKDKLVKEETVDDCDSFKNDYVINFSVSNKVYAYLMNHITYNQNFFDEKNIKNDTNIVQFSLPYQEFVDNFCNDEDDVVKAVVAEVFKQVENDCNQYYPNHNEAVVDKNSVSLVRLYHDLNNRLLEHSNVLTNNLILTAGYTCVNKKEEQNTVNTNDNKDEWRCDIKKSIDMLIEAGVTVVRCD